MPVPFLVSIFCVLFSVLPLWGEDWVAADTLLPADTEEVSVSEAASGVAPDTLPAEVLQSLMAHWAQRSESASPSRKAAATPLLDSVVYTDQDGKMVRREAYDYDASGRRFRTVTEYFDASGGHTSSSSVSEYGYSGNTQVLNATLKWANNQWEGSTRRETVYNDANKQITIATYSWNPTYSSWTPTASTTYGYDASWRILEQWTWAINGTTKKLQPATRTQQEWSATGQLLLKVVYKGGQDAAGNWLGGSGGTKNSYAYQMYGSANKKVLDEAYTWNTSLNTWVGKTSGKTTWEYTANGSYETAKVLFNWNASTLTYDTASAIYKEYDAANHELSSFPYKWTNGVRAGNGTGTRTTYSGNNKDSVYSYTWRNGEWACTKIVVKLVNAANKVTVNETRNYNTSGVGSGTGTYTYYAANNTTITAQTTYTLANSLWTPKDSTAYIYSGSTKIADETYTWSTTLSQWVGTTHKEYLSGSGWTANITKTYDSSTDSWIITSGSKTLSFTDAEGATGSVTYTCNTDSVWSLSTGSKSRSFTDASGASVFLTWGLNSDSVWSIRAGTRTPPNQMDAQGHIILQSSYYCSTDSIWKVTSYTVWEYNSNNAQIYYAKFNRDSVPVDLSIANYNSAGVKTIEEQYTWSNSQWQGSHCYVYGYAADSTTLISQTIYHGWNNSCNTWAGSSRSEWVYNLSGQRDYQIDYTWNNTNCTWVYNTKHTYTYNASGDVLTDIEERYSNNSWNNYVKKEYAYTGSTMTVNNTYNWQDGQWVISLQNETTLIPGSSSVASEANATYQNGNIATLNEITYLPGTTLSKTTVSTTYNEDGSVATYTLATYHYNTEP